MKNKRIFYTEFAYVLAVVALALGTALMEKADFGVSMVVAPAYILHLKISQYLPFFTFGMAEYSLQAVMLILLFAVIRKFKISYLFSFVTAVLYGLTLDLLIWMLSSVPSDIMMLRIVLFVIGVMCCTFGVSMFFHTYISGEVYELFVIEVSRKFNININKFKTAYDCTSCLVSICLSFMFFGLWQFEGVKIGTVICAVINGTIIGLWSKLFESKFDFTDKLRLRAYFEK